MLQQLDTADSVRHKLARRTTQKHKAEFGQFMTPSSVARFIASLFPTSNIKTCHLLDAGAGVGALTCAFLDRWTANGFGFNSVEVTAFEVDKRLTDYLSQHLNSYDHVTTRIFSDDYIKLATDKGLQNQGYTHAILNPPYKKINSKSAHRLALSKVGIETVNLYSAFIALALAQMASGGQMVAIIPRSFCNGPYYRPFRDFVLERAAIRQMHLFESRSKAFSDDQVLQENIIICLERDGQQGPVTISTSTDDSFSDLINCEIPFERIVFPNDPERFIHVQTTTDKSAVELSSAVRYSMIDIGVKLSTGPVVDFRLKEHLRDMPEEGAVPLIYPAHLKAYKTDWPIANFKKSNAIMANNDTGKWLYPNGFYCVVKRFSSKEERRRVVANLITPTDFSEYTMLGFENHLNVFHDNKNGLPEALASGLTVYLNTTAVDEHFRRFSGHTQVNATDLKQMKYPSRKALIKLGEWALKQKNITQENIDAQFRDLI